MTILTLLMTGIVTLESMVGYAELTEIVNGLIQILYVMIDNLLSEKCRYDKKHQVKTSMKNIFPLE